jgi:hypothetical protein
MSGGSHYEASSVDLVLLGGGDTKSATPVIRGDPTPGVV